MTLFFFSIYFSALWLNFPGLCMILYICCLIGIVLYDFYKNCDPATFGLVKQADQVCKENNDIRLSFFLNLTSYYFCFISFLFLISLLFVDMPLNKETKSCLSPHPSLSAIALYRSCTSLLTLVCPYVVVL